MHIKLGSRKSHLAKKQAYMVKDKLEALGHSVELFLKPSMGDLNLDIDLSSTTEKGVFTQDFTKLLHEKKVDCVVHSWKDLPIDLGASSKVVATLDREDSRDLVLVKNDSLKNKNWTVLTSSPRREFHLNEFFTYLNDKKTEFSFKAIRGNIPTRFKKFLEDSNADAFCVALAAVKRLVKDKSFNEDYPGVWESLLSSCKWAILPESYCPSAAAQGALALEVLNERRDLIKVLKEINVENDRLSVVEERMALKSYGGGCHLAIGTQVYNLPQGILKFSSGNHKGESFRDIKFSPKDSYPKKIEESKLWLSTIEVKAGRETIDCEFHESEKSSVMVTRFESFKSIEDKNYDELFTSGLKTWKKLYQKGVWVNGCLDSLGPSFYPKDVFSKGIKNHIWLTRKGVKGPDTFITKETYKLSTTLKESSFEGKEYFVWMSAELLIESLLKHPRLKEKCHFVGLGRSYERLEESLKETGLKKGVNLFCFYNIKQLKNDLIKS